MFDIGFTELLLVSVIGLLVIGPKRLPETIRFLGLWSGRLKRSISRAYREVEREVGMDEVRRQLHNEEILRSLDEFKEDLGSGVGTPTAGQPPEQVKKTSEDGTDGGS